HGGAGSWHLTTHSRRTALPPLNSSVRPLMDVNLPAAERIWIGVAPDGTEHQVHISVGVPTQQPGGEWTAPVSLGAVEARVYKIAGIDAWQAVTLAMQFAATRIGDFAEDGWQFFWERGGSPAKPSDLAGGLREP
ncbi:hypothetical protein, partial [Oleiagrimonas sp. MCCC 1A03011]|uniref:DUF6968 family protein n=1 Tax=Oleiagrimonas sp. MCCC 1A03011 TaxID=1926883 RepID=UPI0019807122